MKSAEQYLIFTVFSTSVGTTVASLQSNKSGIANSL